MACTGKHTKYQPTPEEWKCPKCGVGADVARGDRVDQGWILQDPAADAADDCDLNHDKDSIGCDQCGYGCSGAAFARRLQRARGLVPCRTCKGSGLVEEGKADAALELLRPFAEVGRALRPKAAAFRVLGGQFGNLPLDAWLKAADLLYPEEKKP